MDAAAVNAPVFLSASEPYEGRDKEYLEASNIANLRDAVRALCAHVLPHTTLVFGGHPAITPLVRGIATALECQGNVLLFQSRLYVAETCDPDTMLTTAHAGDGSEVRVGIASRNVSLLRMRYEMLGQPHGAPVHAKLEGFRNHLGAERRARLQTSAFSAGFFIGGMDGVEREYRIFRSFHPGTPAYPIGSTGSAATKLLRHQMTAFRFADRPDAANMMHDLGTETAYSLLMERLLPLRAATPVRSYVGPDTEMSDPNEHLEPAKLDQDRPVPQPRTPE